MKVELLSPGGSYETVISAINAGADAVYVGASSFSARAEANNLNTEDFCRVLYYAHLRDKKIYLTLNTLMRDDEIDKNLYPLLAPLYENGLDAVIVQDMGVLLWIRKYFPDLKIHASTQMTIEGTKTAKALSKLEVSRIIVPREFSFDEIEDFCKIHNMEVECFVHGALCYCYSGQCLMSSFIGGRSGNRGRCAQPCRLPYDLHNENTIANSKKEKYILSPKDLCGLGSIPKLIDMGVTSLKIEGRMKKPEYVAGVTHIYRQYIDGYLNSGSTYDVSPDDIKKLGDLFQRNGFTDGYFKKHNDAEMISKYEPAFRKENREYIQSIRRDFWGETPGHTVEVNFCCHADSPIKLSAQIFGHDILVCGDIPKPAKTMPIDEKTVKRQLEKSGDSAFKIKVCNIEIDDNLFLAVGVLNELRRNFLKKLEKTILEGYQRKIQLDAYDNDVNATDKGVSANTKLSLNDLEDKKDIKISASVCNKEQFFECKNAKFVKRIYLEQSEFSNEELTFLLKEGKRSKKEVFLALPFVFRQNEQKKCNTDLIFKFDGVLVRNIEEYYRLLEYNKSFKYMLDANVYTFNSYAKHYFEDLSTNDKKIETTIPLELNYKQLLRRGCLHEEMLVYGYLPVMVSAGCVKKTCKIKCGATKETALRDRKGNIFKIRCVCGFCYNIIYNCKPLSLFSCENEVKKLQLSSLRLSFTFEDRDSTKKILKKAEKSFILKENVCDEENTTRGHFHRGVL